MIIMSPRMELITAAQVMALGSVSEASLISSAALDQHMHSRYHLRLSTPHSHICTPQSKPTMERTDVDKPTMKDVPVVLHPPSLVNDVKTSLASLRGARTQIGIMMAKRPTI